MECNKIARQSISLSVYMYKYMKVSIHKGQLTSKNSLETRKALKGQGDKEKQEDREKFGEEENM